MLRLALLVLPLLLLQERGWKLADPKPVEGTRVVQLDGLEQLECAECHVEETREWARTLHANAWVDRAYQAELAKTKRKQGCLACHIPQPLHGAEGELVEQLTARTDDKHFGVSCASCHAGPGGVQYGPRGAATDAHPTARAETFVGAGSNALCVRCHDTTVGPVIGVAKDFVEAGLERRGLTCVGCHMGERVIETPGQPARTVRSHALQTPRDPAFLARAFGLTAKRQGGRVVVEVENLAGHRVPGLIGRKLELEARLLDASGKEVGKSKLALDHQSHLPVGAKVRLELAGDGVRVELTGVHHDPRLKEKVRFLEQGLSVE